MFYKAKQPMYNSLGNYLPKRKGVCAYISGVYAYISDFGNRPENELRTAKNLENRLVT